MQLKFAVIGIGCTFVSTKQSDDKKMKKAITKKIRQGHYLHLASGLHIVYTMGDVTGYWNIWENEECTSEWMVSIPTKWQAIDKIEKSFSTF